MKSKMGEMIISCPFWIFFVAHQIIVAIFLGRFYKKNYLCNVLIC